MLYTALWMVTGWTVWRCWAQWRRGGDRLWPAKWDALSWALFMLAFATIMTLAPLDTPPVITISLTTALLVAAAASAIAKPVATRRAHAATRAMRSGLGLPTERALWRSGAIAALWGAAGLLIWMAWLFSVAAGWWTTPMEQAVDQSLVAATGVTILACAHVARQEARIQREQRRTRAAEHDYLTGTTPQSDLPQ